MEGVWVGVEGLTDKSSRAEERLKRGEAVRRGSGLKLTIRTPPPPPPFPRPTPRGLAQLDGFVHVETGDVIVMDVRAAPKMTDGHPLLQQVGQWADAVCCLGLKALGRPAGSLCLNRNTPHYPLTHQTPFPLLPTPPKALLESPPLLPHQLFRHQLSLALTAAEAERAAASSTRLGASAWYAASAGAAGGEAGAAGGGEEYELDLDTAIGMGGAEGGEEEGLEDDLQPGMAGYSL
jgi:hypothetical protein